MQFELKQYGAVLATRPAGREVREAIESLLDANKVMELDFEGVLAISPSCADELIGRLFSALADGDLGDSRLLLVNLTADHREILEPILRRRGLIAPEITGQGVALLNAGDHLVETFELARTLGEFRTADVADKEGLSVPAANNRLARLLKSRLLRRIEHNAPHGGKEFLYSAQV